MREVILWLLRISLLIFITFLIHKIYKINPFFVQVFGGFLFFVLCIIQEEKVIINTDVIEHQRRFLFNLIKIRKQFKVKELKDIIIAGNTNLTSDLWGLVFPYSQNGYNEIRVIYKNGDVKNYRTAIYLDDLQQLEVELGKLLNKK